MTVRIWHQSITDLSDVPGYADRLRAIGARIARPDTRIDVHGVRKGSYPRDVPPIVALRSPWAHHLLATQVVLGAVAAERAGYDAVTISCFYDPALAEARDAVRIPVVSACEASILAAAELGGPAGLIALDDHQRQHLTGLVARHGLTDRVASIVALEPALTEHDLSGAMSEEAILTAVAEAGARALAHGAEVIVPAEGVLNARVVEGGMRELDGKPVLDAFATLVVTAERMVDGAEHADPADDRWATFRAAAGAALLER